MHTAYLLTGGNLGDRFLNLQSARETIAQRCGTLVSASGIYETAAWGKTDQPAFLNQVLELRTNLEPQELMQELLAIEKELGRVREEKMGPRLIDIDILLIDELVMNTTGLTLPHPALPLRRFALAPLAEIAGGRIHPMLKKTIAELLTDCPDKLPVAKIS